MILLLHYFDSAQVGLIQTRGRQRVAPRDILQVAIQHIAQVCRKLETRHFRQQHLQLARYPSLAAIEQRQLRRRFRDRQ